jgi:coenzyme F420-reducing hydrogenase alpha subunit
MNERTVSIHVPAMTRVEGEGALHLDIVDGRIETLSLAIFEPPRYFEKFLEGRRHSEVIDAVARICGICPVAYQMTAAQALEQAFDVDPGPWVRDMRRVFYCAEWLQSHALHVHLLAAPDFLGYANVVDMAQAHPQVVARGLRLQALGNDIIRLLGGRSVHPIGARVGGFWRAPPASAVATIRERLNQATSDAAALIAWAADLPVPEDDQDFVCVALRHPSDYPLGEGRIVSDHGLDIPAAGFENRFAESQRAHSTALFAHLDGQPYLVGPLARLNLNLDRLPAATREQLAATGIAFPSRNMFHSLLARAVEIHVAVVEALRLLQAYAEPAAAYVEAGPRAGSACAATEAPRGLLWHRYDLDQDGIVRGARIVPPTSQNQARIEADLHRSLHRLGLDSSDETLRLRAETVIRNYDPCISCATHFLTLDCRRR